MTEVRPAHEHLLGRTLDGRYRIDELVGVGGMATVFRGMQLSIDREVAIKVIHPDVVHDPEIAGRLLDAGKLACQITAPAIVNTFDFGRTEDGIVYLVTERLRGHTLASELGRPMSARRLAGIAVQVATALDVAARAGLVHHCLSPNNIILVDESTRRDAVKVVDFGLVPPSHRAGEALRARYWAPEQCGAGQIAGAAADQYALGCIMYEAIAGVPPFADPSAEQLRRQHETRKPPALPPSTPRALADAIERLLAKSPQHRFRDVRDLVRALDPLVAIGGGGSSAGIELPVTTGGRIVGKQEITAMTQSPIHQPMVMPVPTPQPTMPMAPSRGGGGRRVLVIAIVAIVTSGLGLLGYVLATRG